MFLGRGAEARAEYRAHRGKVLADHGPWEELIIKEFAELRERGREHALMAEIESEFRTPKP